MTTIYERYSSQLQDPDQWARVEALRVLAMVEETRALRAIEAVFRTDSEPGVRQVAQWAGKIIYAAYKLEKAGPASAPAENIHEERMLESLVEKRAGVYHGMQAAKLQSELQEALREQKTAPQQPLPLLDIAPPKPGGQNANEPVPLSPELLALLDSGLSLRLADD
jgi:hypothetical protein